MAEKSLYWYTAGFAGDIGDGGAPYTQEEQRLYDHALLAGNEADSGVWQGILNELEVTGSATPLAVNTGRASVYGFPYWNDASVNVAVSTPVVGDTGGRLVLRASWATQTVRATVVMNTDGNAGIPALVQVAGTTWDVPLATFVIDTSGDIWTDSGVSVAGVTDTRQFSRTPFTGLALETRQGGDPTDWLVTGTTDYPVTFKPLIQAGRVTTDLVTARATIVYAEQFAAIPFLFFQPNILGLEAVVVYPLNQLATGFQLEARYIDGTDATNMPISWVAIGVKV